MDIDGLIREVSEEAGFCQFAQVFAERSVRTWSTARERALLYGLANRHTPNGLIVELGSFCGGSASFFAKGLADKPSRSPARVVCVDPLLGAPPWLALPPQFFTKTELEANVRAFGLADYVDLRIGDSAAVGATWPAEPIDVLLIDGDHSFEGALRDFECWAPKIRTGGVLLFDDIDNIPEMRTLNNIMLRMTSLGNKGAVDGIGVYEVREGGWPLLQELQDLLVAGNIFRPWSYDGVHARSLVPPYRATHQWTEPALELAYDLGYLNVADSGDYGLVADAPTELSGVLRSVHADRGNGDLHVVRDIAAYGRVFQLIACRPEDAPAMRPKLVAGGTVIAWSDAPVSAEDASRLAEAMRQAGFDGVGHGGEERPMFWGVADIEALAPLKVIKGLMAARTGARGSAPRAGTS